MDYATGAVTRDDVELHVSPDPQTRKRKIVCKQELIIQSLLQFYSTRSDLVEILQILEGESIMSLRLIDWFVTNYSKYHNISYIHKNQDFFVYIDYKNQLKAYSKKLFDPFCRRERILFQLTNIPDALLLLRLHQIGFSAKGVVASYMLFSAVSTLLSYPAGVIADKLNPRIVYAVGLVAFGFGYLTLGLTSNHSLAIVAIVIYGIFPALTDGVGKAWIASVSPSAHRGKVQGVYQSSMNFAVLGAGIWGGAMWSTGSIQWSLVIAGVGSLIGSLVLLIIRPQHVQP